MRLGEVTRFKIQQPTVGGMVVTACSAFTFRQGVALSDAIRRAREVAARERSIRRWKACKALHGIK